MINVLLVGAGNLGRRHLQSLKSCRHPLRISVVEPFSEARRLAETAYLQAPGGDAEKDVSFHRSLDEIDQTIDLAIDATPATGRLDILKQVLGLGAKDLVLEKVAFNAESDIEQACTLVEKSGARPWVNCPRRLNPFYLELRDELANTTVKRFDVVGENFGMACNAIHFIDLFSFLAGQSQYDINLAGVKKVVPSKRSNYIEFFGMASGAFESGPDLQIDCTESSDGVNFRIKISTSQNEYVIDEIAGRVEITRPDGSEEVRDFHQPYQSKLTGPLVDEIVQHQTCGLTEFSESMALHRPFIRAAYALYASKYEENPKCRVPIT